MRVQVFFWTAVLVLRVGSAQDSCFPYLTDGCMEDPQQYLCVKCTSDLTNTQGGESTQILQELCFSLNSPILGGFDPDAGEETGYSLEVDRGELKIGELSKGDAVGQIRFDTEVVPGVTALMVLPITVTETDEAFVEIQAKVTEVNAIMIDEVLSYDPSDEAHNNGLMLQGELRPRTQGGFTMFLHLAQLEPTASDPGLEYSDLDGTATPAPVFLQPITMDDLFVLPSAGGPLVVTTTLSAMNEFAESVWVEFEDEFAITPGAGGPQFRRGDTNRDGSVNIADAIYILQNLFAEGPPIACPDAADSNDDESVNIADGIYILQNLFASGPAIPPPHPDCGPDTTPHPTGGEDLPACDYCPGACQDPPVACGEPQEEPEE